MEVLRGELHARRHIPARTHSLEGLLGQHGLSLLMLLEKLVLLPHGCYGIGAVELVLQMVLLLLIHLLLSGIHLLKREGLGVSTRWHGPHQRRVNLSTRRGHGHVAAGKLMRHRAAWAALLARIRGHARSHGVASNTRVSHASRMPGKVGAHACGHHR
jgi:hypothetical protein